MIFLLVNEELPFWARSIILGHAQKTKKKQNLGTQIFFFRRGGRI